MNVCAVFLLKHRVKGEIKRRFTELVNPLSARANPYTHEHPISKFLNNLNPSISEETVPQNDENNNRNLLASTGDLGVYKAAGTGTNVSISDISTLLQFIM